jgi:peptidoglycan glycosyltransferase
MQFTREINRLLLALLIAFCIVALAAAYWAVVGPDTILLRPDNPRLVLAEANIRRGSIFDRNDKLLVTSLPRENGIQRDYLQPAAYSALGYFSLRYGTSGAEAAFDEILRGDDLTHGLSDNLLHRPRRGSDIRLTLDMDVQSQVAAALGEHTGAVVVLAVPSGEVLALVSAPTFDPNALDANWEQLTKAPGQPFFNRALQGRYQPGGVLQTPLIGAALLSNHPLDTSIANATRPVRIANVELRCAVYLPVRSLTLREAYAFGCPAPFAQLVNELGLGTAQAAFDTFHLRDLPTLPGFVVQPQVAATQTPQFLLTPDNLLENALGQGSLNVTPMGMAVIASAIVNDGNAPQPTALLAARRPDTNTWIPNSDSRPSLPLTTANTARQLQDMMRLAVAQGAAQNAGRPNVDIGGHAALAYSGNQSQAWFVGFATLGGRQGVAVAVVLENSSDPGLAADIGGTALAIAHHKFQP